MTFRVMWHHGTPWPEFHDFAYEQAADIDDNHPEGDQQ